MNFRYSKLDVDASLERRLIFALWCLYRRLYGFYIYKVMLINVILSVWSWAIFWMEASDFADRMNVSLTLFLANVAFLFVISDKLPKVRQMT
jgi:hypothetical protein